MRLKLLWFQPIKLKNKTLGKRGWWGSMSKELQANIHTGIWSTQPGVSAGVRSRVENGVEERLRCTLTSHRTES